MARNDNSPITDRIDANKSKKKYTESDTSTANKVKKMSSSMALGGKKSKQGFS